jgi:hypothetical protein
MKRLDASLQNPKVMPELRRRFGDTGAMLRLFSIITLSSLAGWVIVQRSPLSVSLALLLVAGLAFVVSLWM